MNPGFMTQDEFYAKKIQRYNGVLYCSVYKSDELVEKIAGKDFSDIFQTLKNDSASKEAKEITTGMLIEVPPINHQWMGYDYGDFYLNRNGVLTL